MITEFVLSAVMLISTTLLLLRLKGVPKPKNLLPGKKLLIIKMCLFKDFFLIIVKSEPKEWPIFGYIPKIIFRTRTSRTFI